MTDELQDDTLELTDDMLAPDGQDEQRQPEDDALELEIEGEDDVDDTPAIRQLRQRLRDSERELHETRRAQQPRQVEVGKKPDLWEDCDGDADRFEAELLAWEGRKREVEQGQQRVQEQERARNQSFERARGKYQERAGALKIKGFAEAEKAVVDTLGPEFLGAMIQYADEPAKLVGALGNNAAALARVASEPDPMRQFKMLIDMERKIKVPTRNAPPAPEADTIQRGTAPVAKVSADKKLAQLEADARRTGDRSKLRDYRRDKGLRA